MSKLLVVVTVAISLTFTMLYGGMKFVKEDLRVSEAKEDVVKLPDSKKKGSMSLEEAIEKRRSIREYSSKPLTLKELGQILWAAQGITDPFNMFRSAPSAGATYPLEVYVVVKTGGVKNLSEGVYHYDPFTHTLKLVKRGAFSFELYEACLEQEWVLNAPVDIVITAIYERTTSRYGDRGIRYVHMEAGHVGQNIYLQATALGLGTVAIGAFHDRQVEEIVGAAPNEKALYVYPVGHRGKTGGES